MTMDCPGDKTLPRHWAAEHQAAPASFQPATEDSLHSGLLAHTLGYQGLH